MTGAPSAPGLGGGSDLIDPAKKASAPPNPADQKAEEQR